MADADADAARRVPLSGTVGRTPSPAAGRVPAATPTATRSSQRVETPTAAWVERRSAEGPRPEFRVRRPSSQASGGVAPAPPRVEPRVAQVLEWSGDGFILTAVDGVDELRKEITRKDDLGSSGGPGHPGLAASGAGAGNKTQRLVVLQGLPAEYVAALRTSLDIDPAFLEAHAGRRRYRPRRGRRNARFACFEYPELVRRTAHPGESKAPGALAGTSATVSHDGGRRPSSNAETSIDLMDAPPVQPMGPDGAGVVFCRASLWLGPQSEVLFLDRPSWREQASALRKAHRPSSITRPYHLDSPKPGSNLWEVELSEGDEFPDLQDSLYFRLKDAATSGDDVIAVLAGLAFDHWLDFFETLPPPSRFRSGSAVMQYDAPGLLWQVTQSLEQNLEGAQPLSRQAGNGSSNYGPAAGNSVSASPDWPTLLDRTSRRVELSRLASHQALTLTTTESSTLSTVTHHPSTTSPPPPPAEEPPLSNFKPQIRARAAVNLVNRPSAREPDEQNQRSLDRVTYLGGFLLPFTVVSGILSMNDEYSPTGPQFWIFWVASALSAAACLLVIYLDQLATLEAWFEVAADDAVGAFIQTAAPAARPANKINGGSTGSIPPRVEGRTYDMPLVHEPASGVTYAAPVPEAVLEDAEGEEEEVLADSAEHPTTIVQRRTDGSGARTWRRRPLGWGGALKRCVGYYSWAGAPNMRFSRPGAEDDLRVRTM